MSVAETILKQLGGSWFKVMTGAKDFMSHENALVFRFPRCKGGTCKGASRCRIELTPDDTYTVSFFKVWKRECVEFQVQTGIYFDQLEEVFTECTGLYTRL